MNSALSMAGMALRAGRLEVGEDPAGSKGAGPGYRMWLMASFRGITVSRSIP